MINQKHPKIYCDNIQLFSIQFFYNLMVKYNLDFFLIIYLKMLLIRPALLS